MGKKITQYPNNVSTNPDNLSLLDLSEKTGASTFESRKWNLTAFKAWVNSWVVAGSVAWSNITGKPNVVDTTGGTANYVAKFTDTDTIEESQIQDNGSRVGIGTSGETDTFTTIRNSTYNITTGSFNTTTTGTNRGSYSGATGVGASFNYGSENYASGATGVNAGSVNKSLSNTGASIGAICIAQGTASKYAIQLQDGTEGTGKFLKSVSNDGRANWANITASDVQGAVGAVNGTNNYIAKFTPDGTTIGNSLIQDDGTSITIGTTTYADSKISITDSIKTKIFNIIQSKGNGSNTSVNIQSIGSGATSNTGIQGSSANATTNIGILGIADNGTTCIGLKATASNGTNKYSAQLQDGTEAEGKFLKSVTVDGRANWATITASDISGVVDTTGGTANYISKFTDANTIEESLIIDDGTNIGIGTATPSAKLHINNTGSSESFRVEDETSVDSTPFIIDSAGNVGIGDFAPFTKLTVNGTSAILGTVNSNEGSLYIDHAGVSAWKIGVTSTNTSTLHIGNGTAFANKILNITNDEKVGVGTLTPSAKLDVNGDVKIKDGTEGEGKFLKSVTNDGKANWGYVPKVVQLAVSDETTALTTGTGKITFRMPYGMTLTEVRASLTTAQTSGSILTINVRENGGQIFSTKLTIDNTEKTSVTATTPYVLQDTSLGDDSEITVDIDQLGDGTAKGLKITLIGY